MTRLENPAAPEISSVNWRFCLVSLPVEVGLVAALFYFVQSDGLLSLPVPLWLLGAIIGFLYWAPVTWALRRSIQARAAGRIPVAIELEEGGFRAELPPVTEPSPTVPPQVTVPWSNVTRIRRGGLFLPGMVFYRQGEGPRATVVGSPTPETLYLTKEVASKFDEAWRTWKARNALSGLASASAN
jgi:hypothetical protein